ncbi:hypothetical protein K1W54_09515 [Micromonospora sp. CPCC 205371]|nr:hypothetical protein [Micromonospora sp. CPCC 205371]
MTARRGLWRVRAPRRVPTRHGRRAIGSGRVEVVYDPQDPANHHVKVDGWGTAIPYVATVAFALMAISLPAGLIYAFV